MVGNNISERVVGLKAEIEELKCKNRGFWAKGQRDELDKSAHVLRQKQLLVIKQELAEMKRSA